MRRHLRYLLQLYIRVVPLRGRHRLADTIGALIATDEELLNIGGLNIRINHRELMCRHIYYGVYEEPLINFLKKQVRNGDVVLDPGTNIGYITAVCLGLVGSRGHVHSFEPSRTCFEQLASDNNWGLITNLTMNHAAISCESGRELFYDTPRAISRGFACLGNVEVPEDGTGYPINVFSIDDYCTRKNIQHVRFLKLDVEGAELLALRGAHSMLKRGAIDFILVETEINPDNIGSVRQNNEILQTLYESGYSAFTVDRKGKLHSLQINSNTYLRTDILWAHNSISN